MSSFISTVSNMDVRPCGAGLLVTFFSGLPSRLKHNMQSDAFGENVSLNALGVSD